MTVHSHLFRNNPEVGAIEMSSHWRMAKQSDRAICNRMVLATKRNKIQIQAATWWILESLCPLKEATHQRPQSVRCHFIWHTQNWQTGTERRREAAQGYPSMVPCTYRPAAWEAETGGWFELKNLRLVWAAEQDSVCIKKYIYVYISDCRADGWEAAVNNPWISFWMILKLGWNDDCTSLQIYWKLLSQTFGKGRSHDM